MSRIGKFKETKSKLVGEGKGLKLVTSSVFLLRIMEVFWN
jgi:hypothetical protein